jgi:hypothetical protein
MALTFERIIDELIKDNKQFSYDKLYAQLIDPKRESSVSIGSILKYNGTNKEFLTNNLISRLKEIFKYSKPESLVPLIDNESAIFLLNNSVITKEWINSYLLPGSKRKIEEELISKVDENINSALSFHKKLLENDFLPIEWVNDYLKSILKNLCLQKISNKLLKKTEIKDIINNGIISEFDLNKYYTKEEIDELLEKPVGFFSLGDWSNVPELLPDRVDVFVLGTPSAGKSIFLAGLLYYMKDLSGRVVFNLHNTSGLTYGNQLVSSVRVGTLPPPTPPRIIQHIPCDVTGTSGAIHPLTFIEMSGEIFKNVYGETTEGIKEKEGGDKLIQHLFSENNKLLFLCIDYMRDKREDAEMDVSQGDNLEYALLFIEQNNIMESVDGICLIITKWDLSNGETVNSFIDKKYLNLKRLCDKLKDKYKIPFEVFTFSIGDFDGRGKYKYNSEYSKKIYEWISGASKIIPGKKKKGFFKKLF